MLCTEDFYPLVNVIVFDSRALLSYLSLSSCNNDSSVLLFYQFPLVQLVIFQLIFSGGYLSEAIFFHCSELELLMLFLLIS